MTLTTLKTLLSGRRERRAISEWVRRMARAFTMTAAELGAASARELVRIPVRKDDRR
jgi:hypothetical protein